MRHLRPSTKGARSGKRRRKASSRRSPPSTRPRPESASWEIGVVGLVDDETALLLVGDVDAGKGDAAVRVEDVEVLGKEPYGD